MEFWNDGVMGRKEEKSLLIENFPLLPFFQYSTIPISQGWRKGEL
jgi:hypothetical protein